MYSPFIIVFAGTADSYCRTYMYIGDISQNNADLLSKL